MKNIYQQPKNYSDRKLRTNTETNQVARTLETRDDFKITFCKLIVLCGTMVRLKNTDLVVMGKSYIQECTHHKFPLQMIELPKM